MEITNYITINPNICHGQPCFKGTRIMVYLVLDLLAAGVTPEEIIKDYYPQLSKKAIMAALKFASELIITEKYVPFPKSKKAEIPLR